MTGKQSLLRSRQAARVTGSSPWRGLVAAAAGVLLLLTLTGCERGPRGLQMIAEKDEPHYRRGQQALASNQKSIALEAFQKVIDKRQGDAPQSHFEVGRLYLEHLKDYVPAIYHFRRYLELTGPNGEDAPRVNQLIQTAQKEFARKLAGNPMEAQYDQLELIDEITRLRSENSRLAAEVERLSRENTQLVSRLGAAPRTGQPVAARAPTSSPWTNAIDDSTPAPSVVPIDQPLPRSSVTAPPPPADANRRYVVQRGDTLAGISRKIYGSAAHWRAIYDANRDVIANPNALRVGVELRLP